MAIEKLEEFARDGQRNTDDLSLTDGFPVIKKPARQWFNWLFYELTKKINEIIDANYLQSSDIIDNLTTAESQKALSANAGKLLQDNKLGKNDNAVSATKLQTARTIGGVSFNGTANINLPGVNTAGNQSTTGNAATATKLQNVRTINGVNFDGTTNITLPSATTAVAGTVQLNNTLTSTSVTQALTAAQGKVLQDNKLGKTENAMSATDCSRQIIAGNGLSGGGALTANRTITLGTPTKITSSSTNSVTTTSHTHEIDNASTSVAGVVQLNNTLTSTSVTQALTAAQGKVLNDQAFGAGQIWQDVQSSRVIGITYTNTTRKPIAISVTQNPVNDNTYLDFYVDGVQISSIANSNQYVQRKTAFFIVPAGSTYKAVGNGVPAQWMELR